MSNSEELPKKDLKRILKNVAWLVYNNVFNLLLSLFVTVKVANHYGALGYGTYQYVISLVAILEVLAYFTDGRVVKKEYDIYDPAKVVFTATLSRLFLSAVSAAAGIIFALFYNGGREFNLILAVLLVNSIVGSTFFGVSNRFEYLLISKRNVIAGNIAAITGSLLQLLAVELQLPIIVLPVISLLTTAITALVIILQYKKEFGLSFETEAFDRDLLKTLYKDSAPLAIASSCAIIYTRCDSIMVGNMLSFAEVGIYAIAIKLINIVNMPLGPIRESFYPNLIQIYRTDKDRYARMYIRLSSFLTWFCVIGVLFSFLVLPYLFKWLNKEYYEALGVYRVYVIYSVVSYNAALRAGHLTLINRGTILAYAQAASVVINIVLNIILIKKYGMYGAAAATAITQFLSLTVSNLFFKKDGREVFKWQIMALNPLEMLPNYRK